MLHFPIDFYRQFVTQSPNGGSVYKSTLKLNDEWDIIIVRSQEGFCVYSSIEIHRKNIVGEFLVSGELTYTNRSDYVQWEKKFSDVIANGSKVIVIDRANIDLVSNNRHHGFEGFVNITEIGEKCATGLENKESKKSNELKSMEGLTNDLERLLDPNTSCFADVILKCDGVSIPAHKNILSVRSPVFAAMFENLMKESLKNEVEVTDIYAGILRALLVYMYTGKTCDVTASSAADLLFAADKYQLQDLKSVCSDVLKDNVSLQNVVRIFVLGDMHSEDLKSFALDYICCKHAEFSVIEKTEEWEILEKEKPALAITVLKSMVKSSNEKLKK